MHAEPTTIAYLAGVIDSDGYITIQRGVKKGVAYFGAKVGIAGTRTQPHELAQSLWGGTISRYEPKDPRHRVQYQWSRYGDNAYDVIAALQPYLRVKTEQARLALELQEDVMFGRGDDPFPWFGPDHDPTPGRDGMRDEVVRVLNQDRRAPLLAGRVLDGRTWDQFPATVAVQP